MSATQPFAPVPVKQIRFSPEPLSQSSFEDAQELYLRYQRLVDRVIDVFGDEVRANLWLSQPNPDFGGQVPFQVAREEQYSLAKLEPVLIRLEHGIYT